MFQRGFILYYFVRSGRLKSEYGHPPKKMVFLTLLKACVGFLFLCTCEERKQPIRRLRFQKDDRSGGTNPGSRLKAEVKVESLF